MNLPRAHTSHEWGVTFGNPREWPGDADVRYLVDNVRAEGEHFLSMLVGQGCSFAIYMSYYLSQTYLR